MILLDQVACLVILIKIVKALFGLEGRLGQSVIRPQNPENGKAVP